MNLRIRAIALLAGLFSMQAATGASSRLEWRQLAPLPDSNGVAGAFAGVAGGKLVVGGGANFPEKKPWEGGRKVWHDAIYVLDEPEGEWRHAGKLPRPLAYGVSATTADGVICVGGSDAARHYAEAFLIRVVNEAGMRLKIDPLPSLPVPLANGAGALVGNTLFVVAGSQEPGEQVAMSRLFALDVSRPDAKWRELEACRGKPRVLPVAAALNDALYLLGGAALQATDGKVSRVYLRDAWCYEPRKGWSQLPDLPKPCVAAPSPAPVVGSQVLLVGGDDGSLAAFTPIEKHPGFPQTLMVFDAHPRTWRIESGVPAPRATAPAALWRGQWIIPSGETRPGMRSPEVWAMDTKGAGR
jgi:N-acetylneuraminic acid mutarotase